MGVVAGVWQLRNSAKLLFKINLLKILKKKKVSSWSNFFQAINNFYEKIKKKFVFWHLINRMKSYGYFFQGVWKDKWIKVVMLDRIYTKYNIYLLLSTDYFYCWNAYDNIASYTAHLRMREFISCTRGEIHNVRQDKSLAEFNNHVWVYF